MSAKPNLLLLPGLVCDARMWQPQIDHLAADIGVAKVADLSGRTDGADSIAALAASALRQAPPGRFALAGLSMGGYVALEIMRQAPERVAGLALLDTSARPDTPEASENRRKAMAQAQSDSDFDAVIDALVPKLILPAKLTRDPALVGLIKDMAHKVGKEAFVRQQTAIMGRIDSRPHLDKIACPTVVVCGRDDVITPVEVHEEIVAAVRGACHFVIEQCGHLSTLDAPAKVAAALQSWLVDIEP